MSVLDCPLLTAMKQEDYLIKTVDANQPHSDRFI